MYIISFLEYKRIPFTHSLHSLFLLAISSVRGPLFLKNPGDSVSKGIFDNDGFLDLDLFGGGLGVGESAKELDSI